MREEGGAREGRRRRREGAGAGPWLLIGLGVLLVSLVVFSARWTRTLKVEHIIVDGRRLMPENDIVSIASVKTGALLADVDLGAVRQRLLQQPMIRSAVVSRVLPSSIRVTVDERIPVALLSGGEMRCVDAEGTLLPRTESREVQDLPVISGIDGLSTVPTGREAGQEDVAGAISILQMAESAGLSHAVSEINMNRGGDIVLTTTEGGVPVTVGRGEYWKKLILLQTFLKDFTNAGELDRLQSVDLRFDGQVLVKWNQAPESGQKKASL